jgi:hypothetical protein
MTANAALAGAVDSAKIVLIIEITRYAFVNMKEPNDQELEDSLEIELPPQLRRGGFQRFGNCYGFYFNDAGEPRFTIGPHCN